MRSTVPILLFLLACPLAAVADFVKGVLVDMWKTREAMYKVSH